MRNVPVRECMFYKRNHFFYNTLNVPSTYDPITPDRFISFLTNHFSSF